MKMQNNTTTKPLNQNRMKPKEKAKEIYTNASKLFKPEEIKTQALISARNIYELAPYNKMEPKNKEYWIFKVPMNIN